MKGWRAQTVIFETLKPFFIVAFAGYSAGDRQCPKPHRSRCAHDRTGSQEPARMAVKGTWKDEAQHARDMGLSEERQCDLIDQ
ncbi:hypothetical protein FOBRF1_005270 [Fusarium oxysporum]